LSLYCLVHGSTQSPEGWKLLRAELESRGHKTLAVDLPIDEPEASAGRYADCIAAALRWAEPAIVVAHSASGLFQPLVPERVEVARLVFLTAVIPKIGTSLIEQYREVPKCSAPVSRGSTPQRTTSLLFSICSTIALLRSPDGLSRRCG